MLRTDLEWQAVEALDAVDCLGWDWWTVREAAERRLQKRGDAESFLNWWETARPAPQRIYAQPKPMIHVSRGIEPDLVATLTALKAP